MSAAAFVDQQGMLHTAGKNIPLGSAAWLAWLEHGKSFRYTEVSPTGEQTSYFSARRKIVRGHYFWYAERRIGPRMRTVYLGRAGAINLPRLQEAAARLQSQREAQLAVAT